MHATQRRYRGDTSAPRFISHRDVLEFATVAGAADVGLGGQIGSLTPGKQAYIVAIRAEDINNLPLNNAVGTVVRGTDTRNVDTVFVGGQVRKWCASWSGWTSGGFAGWPTSCGTIWRPGPVSPLTRSPPPPGVKSRTRICAATSHPASGNNPPFILNARAWHPARPGSQPSVAGRPVRVAGEPRIRSADGWL